MKSTKKIKLKFELNKALDKDILYRFLGYTNVGGLDFNKYILKAYPNLKKNKEFISKFVDEYYNKNIKKIGGKKSEIEKDWRKYENYFFDKVSKLFKQKWPNGKYIAYVSICPINPRWIFNKTFTVFDKTRKNTNIIIVHELLHFMFYDYVDKNFTKKLSEGKKWHLSEIVNVILMNEQFLRRIYVQKEEPYPNHKKYIPSFYKLYKKHKTMYDFIEASIKKINNIKSLT